MEATAPPAPDDRGATRWLALLVSLAAAPPVVAAVVLAVRGWRPTSDLAQADLRMRAFWSHPPQLGAAGRLGTLTQQGAHPGPASWWSMYPLYALLGRTPGALSISVAAVAVAWMVLAVVLARRLGGLRVAATLAVALALYCRALGPAVFTEPWNPWLGIFPFVCCALAVWAATVGRWWGVPAAVAAGSVAVQAHVGYLPIVAGLVAGGTAWFVATRPGGTAVIRSAATAAVAAAVAWALPLYQELRGDPGNLTILYRTFAHPSEDPIGPASALRRGLAVLSVDGPWLVDRTRQELARGPGAGTVVFLVGWATAVWFGRRHRDVAGVARLLRLHAVLACGVVLALVALSRIYGEVFGYLVMWMSALGALVVAASTATVVEVVAGRADGVRVGARGGLRSAAAVTVVACVIAGTSMVRFARPDTPGGRLSHQVAALGPQLDDALDRRLTYVVRWQDPVALGAVGFGMVDDLERRGFRVGADPAFRVAVMEHRVIPPGSGDAALWVVTGPAIESWRARGGADELVFVDVRTADERETVDRLRRSTRDRLAEIGGEDFAAELDVGYWNVILDPRFPDDLSSSIATLGDLGLPVAVFRAPIGLGSP